MNFVHYIHHKISCWSGDFCEFSCVFASWIRWYEQLLRIHLARHLIIGRGTFQVTKRIKCNIGVRFDRNSLGATFRMGDRPLAWANYMVSSYIFPHLVNPMEHPNKYNVTGLGYFILVARSSVQAWFSIPIVFSSTFDGCWWLIRDWTVIAAPWSTRLAQSVSSWISLADEPPPTLCEQAVVDDWLSFQLQFNYSPIFSHLLYETSKTRGHSNPKVEPRIPWTHQISRIPTAALRIIPDPMKLSSVSHFTIHVHVPGSRPPDKQIFPLYPLEVSALCTRLALILTGN